MVSLFMAMGINAFKLECGYKGYRKYINENLPQEVKDTKFVTLYGNTGVGKTEILKHLKNEGMDVLDLEGCANHRGSLLGSIGMGKQNTQKMFESLVYESLKNKKSSYVFVEGESKRIGRIVMPDYLYKAINNDIKLKITASMEFRVNNILKDYVHGNDKEIISALNLLRSNLGNKNVDDYITKVNNSEYREVIEGLMVKYYDPLYEYKNRKYDKIFCNENSKETSRLIIDTIMKGYL